MDETKGFSTLRKYIRKYNWLFPIPVFAVGFFIGWSIHHPNAAISQAPPNVAQREGGYAFTNPLLDCDQAEGLFTELKPFKSKVQDLISQLQNNNTIDYASVYFRDLNNGPWFGINEQATFSPASLLKLPVMLAYYKMNETDPGVLNKNYTYNDNGQDPNIAQSIKPSQTLESGKSYSVKDLLYRMIAYSDNKAHYLLTDNVDVPTLQKVFSDFGINYSGTAQNDIFVNIKNYSTFFRVLFNASYLSRDDSESALKILSESDYKDGLVAGVPSGVAVAHKFGERELAGQNGDQLHDCGIVYYPSHPYLLCVMTRGSNIDSLASAIQQISGLVYSEVSKQN